MKEDLTKATHSMMFAVGSLQDALKMANCCCSTDSFSALDCPVHGRRLLHMEFDKYKHGFNYTIPKAGDQIDLRGDGYEIYTIEKILIDQGVRTLYCDCPHVIHLGPCETMVPGSRN